MTPPPSIPDYSFRALIGEGSTGRVYAADYGGQSPMALKAFDSDCINRQLVSDALVKLFNRDEHPGIVSIFDFDLASVQTYMATSLHGEAYQNANGQEALRPRTIQGLMGHLIPEDSWGYALQIADALAFLHRQRVIHCNLKPSNVLLDGSTPPCVKLTDFSQGLVGSVPKLIPGDSVFYAPPEQIRQPELYFGGRAERWDVYAFGALTFQLLTGSLPRLATAAEEIKKHEAASLDVHFSCDYSVLADMIEQQVDYEWPNPAADDDESARRAIIDRCLAISPDDRFADMREVLLALTAIDQEHERREEHRKFAAQQLASDKNAAGLKKVCAVLGVLALSGLGGAAFFSQRGGGDGGTTDPTTKSSNTPPPSIAKTEQVIDKQELADLHSRLESSTDDLRESQGALDEIFALMISRDRDGNPVHDLPEDSAGLLLNYYEEFATKQQANPDLAAEVAIAESNAGEIQLALGDADAALAHMNNAVNKINLLRGSNPQDARLTIAAARLTKLRGEAYVAAGKSKAAADAAVESNQLWDLVYQANPSSPEAPRALVDSLIFLGERMLEIDRPADTGLHVQRAKTILKGLEADKEFTEDDVVSLSRCDHLLGLSERAGGNLSDAIKLQIEAVDRLLNVKIANVVPSRSQLYSLAVYYGELADALAENGNREDSLIANDEASKLLTELLDAAPSVTNYHFQYARRFATEAALLRDAGKGTDARAAQEKAIAIVRDLLKVHPKRYDIAHELAIELGELMDLYADAGKKQETLDTGAAAVGEISRLLIEDLDVENNDSKRTDYRYTHADLQIRYAQYLDKYGASNDEMKQAALKYYEKGVSQIESLIAANIDSEEIQKMLTNANARIKALSGK